MEAFEYIRPTSLAEAIAAVSDRPTAAYLAGGTTQMDLMLRDGVTSPERLVDITRLPLRGIRHGERMIEVGALTTMEELAADPVVRSRLSVVREALLLGASVQLRNMATIGGNLLQRTRCRYFRDPTVKACNKRDAGSGCAAITGVHRMHAILGTSPHCIALHASDLAVALIALDTIVHIQGAHGRRSIPLTAFYRTPDETPAVENVLAHGEMITSIEVPLLDPEARSGYLKVRDRASYEFALTSAAAALVMEDGRIREGRIALGGVGTIPWRAVAAEQVLSDAPACADTFRRAAEVALEGARTYPGTAFKIELAKRSIVRILETVSEAQS